MLSNVALSFVFFQFKTGKVNSLKIAGMVTCVVGVVVYIVPSILAVSCHTKG